jgi:hypothetical protein
MQPAVVVRPRPAKSSNPLSELQDCGQSVWLDYIRRGLLNSRERQRLRDGDELRGVASNAMHFEFGAHRKTKPASKAA